MPRRHRLDFEGAWHHVMNRGIDHQPTFRDDDDREMFLDLIGATSARFGLEIHAYCLMLNHFHMLIRAPNAQLSRSLQHLGQVYTQRFNRRHGRDGALFRGRFHSIIVDSERYLDTASRYIHLNPVAKASGSMERLSSFRWSSLAAYEGRESAPKWLRQREVLERFASAAAYSDFVRQESASEPVDRFYSSPFEQHAVLGDASFTARLDKLASAAHEIQKPGISLLRPADIDAEILRISQARPSELTAGHGGRLNPVRSVAVQLSYDNTPSSLGVLAKRYGFRSAHSAGSAAKRSSESSSQELRDLRSAVIAALDLAS